MKVELVERETLGGETIERVHIHLSGVEHVLSVDDANDLAVQILQATRLKAVWRLEGSAPLPVLDVPNVYSQCPCRLVEEEIPMTEPKPTYDPGGQEHAAGRARPAERSADGPPENGDPSDASQQSAPTISLQMPPPRSGKLLWAAYIALERFYLARDKAISWGIQGRWAPEKAVAARRAEHDAWEALEPWQRERLVK